MITKITNDDLTEALSKPTAVLDFSAQWCGPCKMLAPVMESVAETMQDEASFYSIDVDENMALAMEYHVSSIPCIVVLKDGKEVARDIGFQPQPGLQAFIEQHL